MNLATPGLAERGDENEVAIARAVADAVRARTPTARSLLQVGCGTGTLLLRRLAGEFEHVGGSNRTPRSGMPPASDVPRVWCTVANHERSTFAWSSTWCWVR